MPINQSKRYYLMAQNGTGAPWSVVAVGMADGRIRNAAPLPAAFPAHLEPCNYTLMANDGWFAYAAAESDGQLLVARFNFTLARPHVPAELVLNASVAAVGLGSVAPYPAAALVTNAGALDVMWLALTHGLAKCTLPAEGQRGLCEAAVTTPCPVSGLQFDLVSTLFALCRPAPPAFDLRLFTMALPASSKPVSWLPLPVAGNVAHGGTAVALVNDHAQVALLLANNTLVTADQTSGAVQAAVPTCAAAACPTSMAYEPFVFR